MTFTPDFRGNSGSASSPYGIHVCLPSKAWLWPREHRYEPFSQGKDSSPGRVAESRPLRTPRNRSAPCTTLEDRWIVCLLNGSHILRLPEKLQSAHGGTARGRKIEFATRELTRPNLSRLRQPCRIKQYDCSSEVFLHQIASIRENCCAPPGDLLRSPTLRYLVICYVIHYE